MKTESTVFGEIEYTADSIIHFEEGLIGVSDHKQFILIQKEDAAPFNYLQSVEDKDFSLVVINPFFVETDYEMSIDSNDLKALDIDRHDDFIVLAVVVLSNQVENITVNLKAPLIINIKSKSAKQILLLHDKYSVSEPLMKSSTLNAYKQNQQDEH
jgi:flagellar assembly factor FliW